MLAAPHLVLDGAAVVAAPWADGRSTSSSAGRPARWPPAYAVPWTSATGPSRTAPAALADPGHRRVLRRRPVLGRPRAAGRPPEPTHHLLAAGGGVRPPGPAHPAVQRRDLRPCRPGRRTAPSPALAGTDEEPGTTLLTLDGDARAPAVVEVAHGTPWREVLHDRAHCPCCSAATTGRGHGRVHCSTDGLPARPRPRGLTLGAGVVLPLEGAARSHAPPRSPPTSPASPRAGVVRAATGFRHSPVSSRAAQRGLDTPGRGQARSRTWWTDAGPVPIPTARQAGPVAARVVPRGDGPPRAAGTAAHSPSEPAGRRMTLRRGPPLVVDWPRCRGGACASSSCPRRSTLDDWGYPIVAPQIDDEPAPRPRGKRCAAARRSPSACSSLAG